jgi:hypothetical protein
LKDPGHGRNGQANFATGAGEKGKHQLAGLQRGFPHQAPERRRLPQAARAARRELSKSGKAHGASLMKENQRGKGLFTLDLILEL